MEAIGELAEEVGRAEIVASVEQAATAAASTTAGTPLTVRLDEDAGELACFATRTVVEEVSDPATEVALADAPEGSSVGDALEVPAEIGSAARSAARAAGEVLATRLRAARVMGRASRYRDRIGEIETGIVQRREGADLIVDLGPVEARVPADEQSRHEVFNPEDTIRAAVVAIRPEEPPVILSRIAPSLVAGLFARENPEVRNGTVQVRAVARHPGLRAKVAVSSETAGINPVAACLGPGGSRVRAVSRELRGERVDVVLWSESVERFVRNALRPAEVLAVEVLPPLPPRGDRRRRGDAFRGRAGEPRVDPSGAQGEDPAGRAGRDGAPETAPDKPSPAVESGEPAGAGGSERPDGNAPRRGRPRLLVTVSADELPRAVGTRGQNVRLAAELVGASIDVVAEGESPGGPRGSRGGPGRGRGPDRGSGRGRDRGADGDRRHDRRSGDRDRPYRGPSRRDRPDRGRPPRRRDDDAGRGPGRPRTRRGPDSDHRPPRPARRPGPRRERSGPPRRREGDDRGER